MKNIKVYATCFWEDDQLLFQTIKRYGFGKTQWKNIEFTLQDDYERVIILTAPHEFSKPIKDTDKVITLLTEPPESLHHHRKYPSSESPDIYVFLPFWEHITDIQKPDISRLEIPKEKMLSSVTSELSHLEGHLLRLELIYHLDYMIEEGFDLWGKKYTGSFFDLVKSYRGPLFNKYDALWSYKYHFACENTFHRNYFTEKIADPLIAECLCFYDGCLNISDFIDDRAFIAIDVHKPTEAVEKIIMAIQNDEWEKRIPFIRQQKTRILFELNPLNIMWMAVNEMDVLSACKLR